MLRSHFAFVSSACSQNANRVKTIVMEKNVHINNQKQKCKYTFQQRFSIQVELHISI